MAKARETTDAVLDVPTDPDAIPCPALVVAQGRGQSGKSVWTRWVIDRARDAGRPVIAADGDRSNATLSSYYKDASRPSSADDPDVHAWITELVERMAVDRVSVALDLGGGDRMMEQYARAFPIAEFCEEAGVRLVCAYFVAPNVDSLAPIAILEDSGAFRPTNTILVLNEGLVPMGQSPVAAFSAVKEHQAFRGVLDHAELVAMPRLGCMPELERRRANFFDPNPASLGPMNAFMVKHWCKEMDAAFAPALSWLP